MDQQGEDPIVQAEEDYRWWYHQGDNRVRWAGQVVVLYNRVLIGAGLDMNAAFETARRCMAWRQEPFPDGPGLVCASVPPLIHWDITTGPPQNSPPPPTREQLPTDQPGLDDWYAAMEEAEWLACTDPEKVLERIQSSGRLSDRKARLFAVACCRRIWPLFTDDRSRRAVEIAEQYAEGLVGEEDLRAAADASFRFAELATYESGVTAGDYDLNFGALCVLHSRYIVDTFAGFASWEAASHAPNWVHGTCMRQAAWAAAAASTSAGYPDVAANEIDWREREGQFESATQSEGAAQARLLRCIFGNPFRLVKLDPTWVVWNSGTISALAQAIYEERTFDWMPLLGDALEDAGCTDATILDHCRGPGPHARGCWVVDLLLGKK
jgi:hypothetical protein